MREGGIQAETQKLKKGMKTGTRRRKRGRYRHIVDRRVESPKADRPGPGKRNYSVGDEVAAWTTNGRGWGSLEELERRLGETPERPKTS